MKHGRSCVNSGVSDKDSEKTWSVVNLHIVCDEGVIIVIRQYHELGLVADERLHKLYI
jgi:hypothetical protein